MSIFKGAGVAIVTPMKSDLEVNYDKLAELLEEQIAGKTDAIIICGTTGESATMSEEEHSKVIRFAIERVNHRIPVIAGTGSSFLRKQPKTVQTDFFLSHRTTTKRRKTV